MNPKSVLSGLEIHQAYQNELQYRLSAEDLSDPCVRLAPSHLERLGERRDQLKRMPRIWIAPFDEARCRKSPNSYDLCLDRKLRIYQLPMNGALDMRQDNPTTELSIPDDGLVLQPGILYLGQTVEYTETHNLVPHIDGRSSLGRLGMSIHVTAGRGDAGFCGVWTLEITVVHPLRVYPGVRICQVSYWTISEQHVPYQGKYQGETTVLASRLYQDLKP